MTKIKVKKKAADWAAQIWSTRPMRYSPVQADQKKPNWAATRPIWQHCTGKSRGGGVCFYINNLWCDERNIHSIKSFCSPDLEFHMLLCRPFWLPREFTLIIITAVYIPPQANTDQALKELYGNISEQETANPDAAFVVTGDFNKASFRTIAPK